jgi:hypothetical protein
MLPAAVVNLNTAVSAHPGPLSGDPGISCPFEMKKASMKLCGWLQATVG